MILTEENPCVAVYVAKETTKYNTRESYVVH